MTAVAIAGLSKRFGATTVLDGVDLAIERGQFAVLVGPSGCGKSTLLRLIAGLERPTAGTIRFGERDVTELAPKDRDIAMVFQSYALYPHLTVRENLAFGLTLKKTPRAEIDARVAEASKMLGLDALLARMPKQLSGGQRQRVAMGRAIVRRPKLFLFDEPLSNLDAALRGQVRVEIRKLHEDLATTSVYVTHDQVEAMTLADVMFVLNRGRVEQAGPPLAIYQRPNTRFVAGFLGSPAMNFLDGTLRDGSVDVAGVRIPVGPRDLADGRRVVLGVRPHDFSPGGPVRLALTFVERLGGETYAHGQLLPPARAGEGGGEGFPTTTIVSRLDATAAVATGETLDLAVPPERVHLFDPESGATL